MAPGPTAHVVVPFALAGGSWIFIGVVVLFFFAVVLGYYTRTGSGISQRPYRRADEAPEAPSELAHDTTQDVRNWTRGTEGHRRPPPGAARHPGDPAVAEALAEWRAGSTADSALDPPIGPDDHVRGPDGAREVALYIDVASEPSRSAYRLLCEFVEAQRIRLAVRQLPLADVRQLSLPAAESLEAAATQGKFFEVLDHLVASGCSDEAQVLDVAAHYVDDPDRLREEVSSGRYRDSVIAQIRQGTSSGAHAVPEVYLDGARYSGPIIRDDVARALRQ
jgi:hypothetical protein